MDLATIFGQLIAWGALVACLVLESGHLSEMFNLPAFVLVVFGTIGATIIGTNIKTIKILPSVLKNAFIENDLDPSRLIDLMVWFARKARRDGVLSLEEAAKKVNNNFFRKGIELIVDGTPSIMVREILETEVVAMQDRHKVGETIFTTMGGLSPTLGIIGTVLGLINMLARLSEPGKMGHAIASAFIATLYGVALANLLYLPIASKLRSKTAEEVVACEMIIEGVLSIQAGDNPRIVETRMAAFLSPRVRSARMAAGKHKGNEETLAA